MFLQICCNIVIERNLFLNFLKKNPSIFNINASLKLLFFHFFRSLSDRVLKVSLLYCNFFSHFQNCKALVSRCSVASAIDFSSFATIFCSIYYKICYKLQKDKMAIALATEHLETNALQFWKWDKKWQYKSDTFITLSDTERKKWKKSSFNNTNYQEILSKCLQRRFRHLETFTLHKSKVELTQKCVTKRLLVDPDR